MLYTSKSLPDFIWPLLFHSVILVRTRFRAYSNNNNNNNNHSGLNFLKVYFLCKISLEADSQSLILGSIMSLKTQGQSVFLLHYANAQLQDYLMAAGTRTITSMKQSAKRKKTKWIKSCFPAESSLIKWPVWTSPISLSLDRSELRHKALPSYKKAEKQPCFFQTTIYST